MRVAGIDCGTNSIRLLIADVDADGQLVDVLRTMRIVPVQPVIAKTRIMTNMFWPANAIITRIRIVLGTQEKISVM